MPHTLRRRLGVYATPTIMMLWIMLAGVIGFMGYTNYSSYANTGALANERANTYAQLIGFHDSALIERAQSLIEGAAEHLSYDEMNGAVSRQRRDEIETVLANHARRFPGIVSFSIIGADGNRRYGISDEHVAMANNAVFVELKDGPKTFFIDGVDEGYKDGSVVRIGLRVMRGPQFAGIVVIKLSVFDVFYPFYATVDVGANSTITLSARSILLAHSPISNSKPGQYLGVSAITKMIGSGISRASVVDTSQIDGQLRYYAFERIGDSNLYVTVGVSADEALATVRLDMLAAIIASLVAIIAGIMATIGLRRLARRNESIQRTAHRDVLTELHNRQFLVDTFAAIASAAIAAGNRLAVIFIDLDNFKQINDTMGHSTGDAMLRQVASRLRDGLQPADIVTRLGGDEFIVIKMLGDGDAKQLTEAACRELLQTLRKPFDLGADRLVTGASVGASILPLHGTTLEELCRKADLAMYRGKAFGRGTYTVYYPNLEDINARENISFHTDLAGAIERNELALYFEPVIGIKSQRIEGAEALLRWVRPDGTVLPAAKFLPMIEHDGLIIPIGEWVVNETCKVAARWQALGLPAITFSINMSATQINQSDVEQMIISALNAHRVPAKSLQIEITESVMLADNEVVQGRIERLSKLGIGFAVDDFGIGYSSLSYLHKFALDTLKIDASFAAGAAHDKRNISLLSAIVRMAEALSMRTTAEGIETIEIMELYKGIGIDSAQGFLFTRPLSPDGLIEFVREFAWQAPNR